MKQKALFYSTFTKSKEILFYVCQLQFWRSKMNKMKKELRKWHLRIVTVFLICKCKENEIYIKKRNQPEGNIYNSLTGTAAVNFPRPPGFLWSTQHGKVTGFNLLLCS